MLATKETSLVLFCGLAAALGLVFLTDRLGAPRRGTVSAKGGWSWRAAATRFWTAPHVALFLAFATLVVLAMGGLVTSHGVGMAVPDWPNTYGYNLFAFPVSCWWPISTGLPNGTGRCDLPV